MIKHTKYTSGSLDIFDITAEKDDVYYLHLAQDITKDELASIAVYMEGEVLREKVSGDIGPYYSGPSTRGPGDTSIDYLVPVILAGRVKYTITTPTFRYICLTDKNKRHLNGKVHRLNTGEHASLSIGKKLFVAKGTISVNEFTLVSMQTLDVVTEPVTVTADEPSLLIEMDLLE